MAFTERMDGLVQHIIKIELPRASGTDCERPEKG
jgi:hypothetical protein